MAKFEAGIAFVQVVPSLKDFHKKIGQELKGLPDQVKVPVSVDAGGAAAAAKRARSDLGGKATVKVSADTGPARTAVQDFEREVERRSTQIRLHADTSGVLADAQTMLARQNTVSVAAEADAKRVQAQIDALAATAPPVEVPVDADITKAEAKIRQLAAKKATAEVEVIATTDQARARIEELTTQRRARVMAIEASMIPVQRQIAALLKRGRDEKVDVTAEVGKAQAQLTKLQAQKRGVEVQVDADISRAQTQIAKAQADWKHTSLTVDADTAIARAKLEELRDSAEVLDGKKIAMRADVEGAERALNIVGLLTAGLSALGAAGPAAAAGLAAAPAALVGLGQIAGTMLAGFDGIGDAVSALEQVQADAASEPGASKEQLDKLADAMAALTPLGREFALFVHRELLPAVHSIGPAVQDELLPAVRSALTLLMGMGPQVRTAFAGTAAVIGDLAERSAQMVTSPLWSNDFTLVTEVNNRIMTSLGGAGLALADALRSVTAAAMPMLDRFAQWVESQALLLNQFIQTKRATGELGVWFSQAADQLAEFGAITVQVGAGIARLLATLAPLGMVLIHMVGNVIEFVGNLATAAPLLFQIGGGALIALAGFVALGRGIDGVKKAVSSAWAGWQGLTGMMTAWQTRATAAGVAASNMATSMTGSVAAGERARGTVGGIVTGVGRLVSALPVASIVVGGLALAMDGLTTSTDEAADALLRGGAAAHQAIQQIEEPGVVSGTLRAVLEGVVGEAGILPIPGAQSLIDSWFPSVEDARARAQELYGAMTPLQQAQTDLTRAQNDYALALQQHGPASAAAAQAQLAVANATDRVEHEQTAAAEATKSLTDRMVEQQMQAISALDKDLALRQAITGVAQAQQAAAAAARDHGAGSTQATVASQQLEQSMLRAAQAARDKALAEHEGASATDRDNAAATAFNQTLAGLVLQAGTAAPIALRQYLANLESSALGAIGARMETDRFGNAVLVLPGEKKVFLGVNGADTAMARINQMREAIKSMPSEHWFTVYTRQIVDTVAPPPKKPNPIPLPLSNADGRIIQPFAVGGIAALTPMRPVAQVVPPQTWRVVGDRLHDDEAYIPVNNSARSQVILAETARRMGYALLPEQQRPIGMATGGLVGRGPAYVNTAPPHRVLPRDGTQVTEAGQQVWSPQITVNTRTDASPEHIAAAVDRRLRIRSRL